MRVDLLGPDGVRQRMAELQARLDTLAPKQADKTFDGGLSAIKPLAGEIGGLSPFAVNRNGVSVQGDPGLVQMAREAASKAGVDPDLFDSLIEVESGYNPLARSRVGALGLAQLMPGTAQELGVSDPTDPEANLKGGAEYLGRMLRRFGDPRKALAAYNAGPGAVERAGGVPPYAETRAYVDRVMRLFDQKRSL